MLIEEYKETYKGMSIAELGAALKSKKDELACLKEAVSGVQGEFDALRKHIVPEAMEVAGIDSVKLTGIGRLHVRAEMYAGIGKEHKEEAFVWLSENGYSDVVKPGVNASTLKALAKECVMNGVEMPDGIFSITPYDIAVITKN